MFAFDLPFLLICGIILGNLMKNQSITQRSNWFIGILLLFIFQAGGIMLWLDIFPGSKEFMIIPFNFFGITVNTFDPIISAILFGFEPILMIVGEYIGFRQTKTKGH